MTAQPEACLLQPRFPTGARAEPGRLVEQAVLLLLPSEPGEFCVERMVRVQERFFSMQDRRVGARRIIEALQLARPQRQLDAAAQRGVRVRLEIREAR